MSFEQYNDQTKEQESTTTQETENQQTASQETSFEQNTAPEKTDEGQGESKETHKFGTDIDKLNKRLQDKDAFIEQLLSERKQDRDKFQRYDEMLGQFEEKLSVFESSNDILEKLRSQDQKKEGNDHVENQNTDPKKEEPKLDPEYLRQQGFLTRDDLEAERMQKQREENLRQVTEKLANKFGDKIDENVRRLAEDTDMTFDEAFELASNKPRAFERLFIGSGTSEKKGSNTGFNSSVNTANFQHNDDTKKVDYLNMSTEDRIRHNMRKLEELSGNQS